MRIDKLIFERGIAKSREAAKQMLISGNIKVDGRQITKPSLDVSEDAQIEVVGETLKYVSRGGLKLEGALDYFKFDVAGLDCVDIGASTGGFTDCLLMRGAKAVRAVDVGRSQLDKKLIDDRRVTLYEGMNARYMTPADIGGKCDLAVCDVSFISLTLIMGAVRGILSEDGSFIALIKPQFEAGKSGVGKNGIVKDKTVHEQVILKVIEFGDTVGLRCADLVKSSIEGGDGNTEYLAFFNKNGGFKKEDINGVIYS